MTEIWTVLLPFLIADVVNPVLFAFMVYAAGTKTPIANSVAVLAGHTLAYFSAGLVLALGLERISERLANPHHLDYFVGLLVGAFLLWVAYKSLRNGTGRKEAGSGDLTPVKAFGSGVIINFVGIPFAMPYFAVLDQVLKADLSVTESLAVLAGYNVVYALPFSVVPLLASILGERSKPLLGRMNDVLDRVSSFLMPLLLALAGLALVADAIRYFVTGEGLF